ncbi:nucleoplasmin-like protein [Drosophila innubila]|uniref:nucleoplasmin-like protein n=1 Tax=Drosophila innubila TaxID=198719 RepID=UPI00148BB2C9|nr:nucleoplasmin-like protein [Drosophila innubila]
MADNENKIFFSTTLRRPGRTIAYWNLSEERDCRMLVITQIVLGAGANDDEYNVVELETAEYGGLPIAALKADENRIKNLHLEFSESEVTITLIEGSGPIIIHGYFVLEDVDNIYGTGNPNITSRCL